MALLTERCLFINFPFYHKTFLSEVDFSWDHHTQRLMSFGHDVNKTPPHQIQVCGPLSLDARLCMIQAQNLYGQPLILVNAELDMKFPRLR